MNSTVLKVTISAESDPPEHVTRGYVYHPTSLT